MNAKKVLLVDDSSTVLLMQRLMLKESGYQIITASNGNEALEKAVFHRPDIIFIDLAMPGMNGFEACKCIRAREETRQIPVIIVSTHGEAENVRRGYECGCTEYITKPFDRTVFLSKLRHYLGN